ncbi:hypothetical protein B0H10DRAFT_2301090 [Mycena sp. CBHHK59/15]|nr:hypothetical protein B0H10DRAFT_2301090 [Mycena sp. CBHHK59/15]
MTVNLSDVEEEISRCFRRIADTKQLWLFFLQDLTARRLVDTPLGQSLSQYSPEQVIAEVKRVVLGPQTWLGTSKKPPIVYRNVVVQTRRPEEDPYPVGARVALFPGANHFIIKSDVLYELWTWRPKGACVFRRHVINQVDCIDTVQIDLRTGESTCLLQIPLPPTVTLEGHAAIWGDFFAAPTENNEPGGSYGVLLVNWRTEQYIIIRGAISGIHYLPPKVRIVSGHLILVTAECGKYISYNQHLYIYDFDSLTSNWRPLKDLHFNHDIKPTSANAAVAVHLGRCDPPLDSRSIQLNAYRSVLHNNTYNVYIYLPYTSDTPSQSQDSTLTLHNLLPWRTQPDVQKGVFFRYQLVLPASAASSLQWKQMSRESVPSRSIQTSSYAGYAVGGYIFPHLSPIHHVKRNDKRQRRQLSLMQGSTHELDRSLSPYSASNAAYTMESHRTYMSHTVTRRIRITRTYLGIRSAVPLPQGRDPCGNLAEHRTVGQGAEGSERHFSRIIRIVTPISRVPPSKLRN